MPQVHKRFTDDQVKDLMQRYLNGSIKRKHVQVVLGIGKSRFFDLLHNYRRDPSSFSVRYNRQSNSRIPTSIEKNMLRELRTDQKLIKSPDVPLKSYNYSFIRNRLESKHNHKVSLSTIIRRAKEHGFYLERRKKPLHDRQVLTNYVGELIQHDSSHHLFAPAAKRKWYLITSLDDYSRFMPYGDLFERETSWTHISASKALITRFGCPYQYYTDSHSIFRFVQGRDSFHRKHYLLTDEKKTQWQQMLKELSVITIPALSPQAKGKIERPYAWLQDHLVRTCAREHVSDIDKARRILYREINHYNYHQVHSTTGEVPYYRFKNAIAEQKSLFRPFCVPPPFKDPKDIFCLRLKRTVDRYRTVSINNFHLKLNKAMPRDTVDLRIAPLGQTIAELRCWSHNKLVEVRRVKASDLRLSTFEW